MREENSFACNETESIIPIESVCPRIFGSNSEVSSSRDSTSIKNDRPIGVFDAEVNIAISPNDSEVALTSVTLVKLNRHYLGVQRWNVKRVRSGVSR